MENHFKGEVIHVDAQHISEKPKRFSKLSMAFMKEMSPLDQKDCSHEERLKGLEEARQPALEMAKEEDAQAKARAEDATMNTGRVH